MVRLKRLLKWTVLLGPLFVIGILIRLHHGGKQSQNGKVGVSTSFVNPDHIYQTNNQTLAEDVINYPPNNLDNNQHDQQSINQVENNHGTIASQDAVNTHVGQVDNNLAKPSQKENNVENRPADSQTWQIDRTFDAKVKFRDLNQLDRTRVIYNRIPKTGSTTTLEVLRQLSMENGFQFHVGKGKRVLGTKSEKQFVNFFQTLPKRFIYARHMMYTNFSRYAHKAPIFINLVRDPGDKTASRYYWVKAGWENRPLMGPIRIAQAGKSKVDTSVKKVEMPPFDRCVLGQTIYKRGACDSIVDNELTQYLCGHDPWCLNPSQQGLQQAKRNIEKNYLAVGVNNDMESFFYVLENLLPDMFRNITNKYKFYGEYLKHMTQSRGRKQILPSTREKLQHFLKLDYDIYNFARQYFYALKRKVENMLNGNIA